MSWEKTVAVLAGLVIGIGLSGGVIAAPASEGLMTAKAAGTGQAYHGTLGTNCTWDLSADGKTLTIAGTGPDGSGTLPEANANPYFGSGVLYDLITKNSNYDALGYLQTIKLSGNLKTGKSADSLFAGFNAFYGGGPISLEGLDTLDTHDTVNMKGMFQRSSFKSLDLSNFNTQKVTNMSSMFNDG
ncbi:BspA family leucine-rich repeat surface protein [Levilactobacillus brevis]|nr:BspA family leucine-rich repeat surface protein [Levilactobacillus brevis]